MGSPALPATISTQEWWTAGFHPYGVVFISRPGGGKKTRILEYSGVEFPPAEPRFRKIDEHTVEIFLPIVGKVFCLQDTWGTLRIKYEFLRIEYPRYDDEDQLPACLRSSSTNPARARSRDGRGDPVPSAGHRLAEVCLRHRRVRETGGCGLHFRDQ